MYTLYRVTPDGKKLVDTKHTKADIKKSAQNAIDIERSQGRTAVRTALYRHKIGERIEVTINGKVHQLPHPSPIFVLKMRDDCSGGDELSWSIKEKGKRVAILAVVKDHEISDFQF